MRLPRLRRHGMAVAAMLATLTAMPAQTTTLTWTGPATASWANGPNGGQYWSGGVLPGPDDDVVVNVSNGVLAIDYTSGDVSIRSITSSNGLSLRTYELSLAAPSTVAGFDMFGASLVGSGSLTVAGPASLLGSDVLIPLHFRGTLAMGAQVNYLAPLTTAGTTSFLGGVVSGGWTNLGALALSKNLDMASAFRNGGSVTQSGTAIYRAGFSNSGSYTATSSFSALGDFDNSGVVTLKGASFAGALLNTGTLTLSTSDFLNAQTSTTLLRNDGTIRITDGMAIIARAQSHFGRIDTSAIGMYVGIDGDGSQSLAVTQGTQMLLYASLPIRNTRFGGSIYFNSAWSPTVLENVVFDDGGASFHTLIGRGSITSLLNRSNATSLTLDGPGATLAGLWTGELAATAGTLVTIAPGSDLNGVRATASLVNHGRMTQVSGLGALTANEADGAISITQATTRTGTIANRGRVDIDANGPVYIGGLRDNSGSFSVGAQTYLWLGDTTVPDLLRIHLTPGAKLGFTGLLDNRVGHFDFTQLPGPVVLAGATLSGGQFTGGRALVGSAPTSVLRGLGVGVTLDKTSIDQLPAFTDASVRIVGTVHSGTPLVMQGGALRFAPDGRFDNDIVAYRTAVENLSVAAGRQVTLRFEQNDVDRRLTGPMQNDGVVRLEGWTRAMPDAWLGSGTVYLTSGSTLSTPFFTSGEGNLFTVGVHLVLQTGARMFYNHDNFNILPGGEVLFEPGIVWESPLRPSFHNQGTLSVAAGAALPHFRADLRGGTLKLGLHDTASFGQLVATCGCGYLDQLGGTLEIVPEAGAHWQAGDRFVILSGNAISGHFDVVPDPTRWQLLYGANDVTLVALAPVPEPATRWLAALGVALLALRRGPGRRPAHPAPCKIDG